MALTETRPETDAPQAQPAETIPVVERVLSTGDHKDIGRLWIITGSMVLIASLVLSAAASIEQADVSSFSSVDDGGMWIQLWSAGRTLLLFGAIVPILVGLATALVPLQVGASALAFSRGAAAAFWTWLLSTGILVAAYIDNGGPSGGKSDSTVLWALALAAMLASIVLALVCVATTLLGARATGLRFEWVPVSAWSFFVFAISGILTLPILIAQLILAYLDVRYGYLPDEASRVSLVGVMDTASLAPAVYWVGIPVLGMAVDAIGTHTGRPIRMHKAAMAAIGLLAIVSFGADYLSFGGRGREIDFSNGIFVAAIVASVLPILATLGLAGESLKNGSFKLRTPMIGGLLSGLLLLLGSAVAVLAVIEPVVGFIEKNFDTSINLDAAWLLNGSAFTEGIRGLVLGSAVVAIIGAVHHWGHKLWGRQLDDRAGGLVVLVAAAGTVLWGFSLVVAGFLSESRFLASDGGEVKDGVELLNLLSGVGLLLLALAGLLLTANILRVASGRGSAVEPWAGTSLEWTTASPPPLGNFASAPVVVSPYPVLDAAESAAADGDAQ